MEINYGSFKSTVEYRNIQFNAGLSENFFEFNPPKGAKVIERSINLPKKLTIDGTRRLVNFTVTAPMYTAGYEFSYAHILKLNGGEMAVMYCSKG